MIKRENRENPPLTAARAQNLLKTCVRELPFDGLFHTFHDMFGRIRTEGFHKTADRGLIAYQLAALLKYIIVYGEDLKRGPWDMARYINAWKGLWRAAEREQTYSRDPDTVATFLLRFMYANLPFSQHQELIHSNLRRALSLFVTYPSQYTHRTFDFNAEFLSRYHLTPEHLIRLGWEFYQAFLRRVDWTEKELESVVPMGLKPSVPQALSILAGSRQKFIHGYREVQATEARQAPYEPNPLLWIPIVVANGRYYAPYPELVAYAATRGLFFRCGSELGAAFHEAFGDWFEAYVGGLLRTKVRSGEVIGAAKEKELGYTGKNVDWTVLLGNAGLLVECKSSALFLPGKILATPSVVSDDLAKNLVGEGKGLFQLHEKLQAVKKGDLPATLRERYSHITTWYPVVILYDQIQHGNSKPVLGNLLDSALRDAGIANFDYQIWHIEELENLLELVPEADLILQIRRKWEDPKMFHWDLNTYLHSIFGHDRLKSYILLPEKDSVSYKILEELSD